MYAFPEVFTNLKECKYGTSEVPMECMHTNSCKLVSTFFCDLCRSGLREPQVSLAGPSELASYNTSNQQILKISD